MQIGVRHLGVLAALSTVWFLTHYQNNLLSLAIGLLKSMPFHVHTQVKRVEDYGVFVEFKANDKTFTALLAADEAKVRDSVHIIDRRECQLHIHMHQSYARL